MDILGQEIPLETLEESRDLLFSEIEALALDVAILKPVVLEPNSGGRTRSRLRALPPTRETRSTRAPVSTSCYAIS